jgi:toxin YhaV
VSGLRFAERNGWRLFRHAEFRHSVDALAADVEGLARQQPDDWQSHPKAKLLRRIVDLIEVEIPRNPNAAEFAQGNTLGPSHRHWRRAKFLGRFRLFFRFDSASRIIVYAWVNDANTLRKAGARTDPYAVFRRKLDEGNPPDDWATLLAEARHAEDATPNRRGC